MSAVSGLPSVVSAVSGLPSVVSAVSGLPSVVSAVSGCHRPLTFASLRACFFALFVWCLLVAPVVPASTSRRPTNLSPGPPSRPPSRPPPSLSTVGRDTCKQKAGVRATFLNQTVTSMCFITNHNTINYIFFQFFFHNGKKFCRLIFMVKLFMGKKFELIFFMAKKFEG